jgi:hypothetical protein
MSCKESMIVLCRLIDQTNSNVAVLGTLRASARVLGTEGLEEAADEEVPLQMGHLSSVSVVEV